jgi:hypothetical protein
MLEPAQVVGFVDIWRRVAAECEKDECDEHDFDEAADAGLRRGPRFVVDVCDRHLCHAMPGKNNRRGAAG